MDSIVYSTIEPWWYADKGIAHERLVAHFKHLDESQYHHRNHAKRNLHLYSRRLSKGMAGADSELQDPGERLHFNLCKSVIDALIAKSGTQRPSPFYLTEKGNFALQERAKRLRKFVMGQFYAIRFYELFTEAFANACIFGNGYIHTYERGGKISAELVFPDEIIVDDTDGVYGKPRMIIRHKQINRDVLMRSYLGRKNEQVIATAGRLRDEHVADQGLSDPVSVLQAWHLPSGPEAKDGRTVVCVSSGDLADAPWQRDTFPIETFRLSKAPRGFYGIGICEELAPLQTELTFLLNKVQEICNLTVETLWLKGGQAAGKATNKVGQVNYYRDQPPVMLKANGVPPELIDRINFLVQQAYALSGVSQLDAASVKPAGLNSGEALKRYNDIGAQRWQHVGRYIEDFVVRGEAEQILDCAREIEARKDGSIEVLCAGDRDVEMIKFADVSIERDKYVTKVWPVSLFPDTPAGKLDTIEKMAGFSPEIQSELLSLMDFPDFDEVRARINAPYDLVMKQLELILEHGKPQVPIPQMDLEKARLHGTLALCEAEKNDAPEDRKELLLAWLSQVDAMLAPPPAEPPMQGAPGAPEAMGPPMPEALPPGAAMPGPEAEALPPM